MILYIENPKDATRKLLEPLNEFSKVAGYKINTHKKRQKTKKQKLIHRNWLHFYILTMKDQKEKLGKQSGLLLHQKE